MAKSPQQAKGPKYPSTDSAYDIAIKSYDWCLDRSNAIDDTIDKLLAWISSVSIAIPTFVFGQHIRGSLDSKWLRTAAILFVGSIVAGIATKVIGSLALISPSELHAKHLHKDEQTFKIDIVYWAGKAFNHNQNLVNWKGRISILMIICFVAEIATLWMWITAS